MALPHYQQEENQEENQPTKREQLANAGKAAGRIGVRIALGRMAMKPAKKLLKKGGKLAAKAALKFGAVLMKTLLSLLAGIGIPTLIIAICSIILVVIISLSFSWFLGTGDGLEGEDRELYEYIVEQADKTVDMSDPSQLPYRVPEKLIAAVIQLDAMQSEDLKAVIKNMAESLAPSFMYDDFNEWTETKTQVCRDGDCASWSETKRMDNWVTKMTEVDYWNGNIVFNYSPYTTEWKSTVKYDSETEKYIDYVTRYKTITTYVPYTDYEYEPYTVTKKVTRKIPIAGPPYVVYVEREIQETAWRKVPVTKYKQVKDVIPEKVAVEKTREIKIKTTTKTRHQRFNESKTETTDYSTLDSVLNSYDFGISGKKLVEVNYMFSDGDIDYSNWLSGSVGSSFTGGGFNGTIIPGSGVPTEYMEFYRGAEKKYGVDWYTLAAVHFVETVFSTHPTMISTVGAIGHMQFMPATWAGWKYNVGGGLVSSSTDITSLAVIKQGNGYGIDGNGDGKADPWNVADSIYTAAHYLSKSGYSSDQRKAIFNYNHADWYVNKVLANAQKFKDAAVYQSPDGEIPEVTSGSFMRPSKGTMTSGYGPRWGTTHEGIDLALNNAPVVAAADGVVSRSYSSGTYGNVVFIKHVIGGRNYETVYAHMTHRTVVAGATVKKGQFLGNQGATGNVTGPHLHFEIHSPAWNIKKTDSLDPALYIPL